jgi:hypothetical protein
VKLVVPVLVIEIALLLLVIPIVPLTLIERLAGETLYEICAKAAEAVRTDKAQPNSNIQQRKD